MSNVTIKKQLYKPQRLEVAKQTLNTERLSKLSFLSRPEKRQLWQLIIDTGYDYSRISIAEHEINNETLVLWLEDKDDFKNSLDDCLELNIPLNTFAKIIQAEGLNSYEGTRTHPDKSYSYKTRIEINEPIAWYNQDATRTEMQWAREAVVKLALTMLVEE
jgi:hypothetical protein